jgi:nicotinamide phosphoribosyltransferase
VNSKGFKVLNHVRIIQGDGISHPDVVEEILMGFMHFGFSAENIAFGMGGGLLQKCDRDTLKYAMKCSALTIDGEWVDVYKDPVTDHGKRSKKGRVWTAWLNGKLMATTLDEMKGSGLDSALELVFKDGEVTKTYTWENVREKAHGKAW